MGTWSHRPVEDDEAAKFLGSLADRDTNTRQETPADRNLRGVGGELGQSGVEWFPFLKGCCRTRCWAVLGNAAMLLAINPLVVFAADPPATVTDAALVLNLRSFPLLDPEVKPAMRTVANLHYEAAGSAEEAYGFHRQQLKAAGWEELDGSYASEQMASGAFSKQGFKLSVSVMPGTEPGKVRIAIINLGNVDTSGLPLPPTSQKLYATSANTTYRTELTPAEAAEQLAKLLAKAGWQPYGEAGDVRFYKQNAVRLKVRVATAPAQDGATVIDLSAEQMSADLPALPNAQNVQYAEATRQLSCEAALTPDEVARQYGDLLRKFSWQPTTEQPVQDGRVSFMIFRNEARDLMQLDMRELESSTRVLLKLRTADEVAAETEQLEKRQVPQSEKPDAPSSPSAGKLVIALPADAKDVDWAADLVEFTVPIGKGKAVFTTLRKGLRDAGWKEESVTVESLSGNLTVIKDQGLVTVLFVDIGGEPAQISIMAIGVELIREKKR